MSERDTAPASTPPMGESLELAPRVRVPVSAVDVTFVNSSGPGGQNVNKRATKAQLRVRIADLPITFGARERLMEMAGPALVGAGERAELLIQADESRSQGRNRDACLDRLRQLLVRAMVVPKVRKKTKPSRGAVERRLDAKRQSGERKRGRQRPEM